MTPDHTLAEIDAALESWETGGDASRWYSDGGPDELAEDELHVVDGAIAVVLSGPLPPGFTADTVYYLVGPDEIARLEPGHLLLKVPGMGWLGRLRQGAP